MNAFKVHEPFAQWLILCLAKFFFFFSSDEHDAEQPFIIHFFCRRASYLRIETVLPCAVGSNLLVLDLHLCAGNVEAVGNSGAS